MYDSRNFLIEEVHPAKGVTLFGRDAVGNLISRQDARDNQLTLFHYDPLHRPDFTDYPGTTPDIDYAYDVDRLSTLTRVTPGGGLSTRQTFDYEIGGDRLARQTLEVGGQSFTTEYNYDALDCLQGIIYPTTTTPVEFRCDDANRVSEVEVEGRLLIDDVDYHPSGQLEGVTYHDALGPVRTTRTYDVRHRVATIQAPGFLDLTYDWDGVGNLETLTDSGQVFTLSYDGLDRLEQAPGPWGSRSYTYDALGNRQTRSANGSVTTSHYSGAYLTATSGGQAGSFAYDLVGNRTQGFGASYVWNRSDRMRQATASGTTETYTYDGDLLRVRKQTGEEDTVYLYAPDGGLLGTLNLDGTTLRRFVHLGGHTVAEVPRLPSLTRFYYIDYQGSVLGASRYPSLRLSE